MGVNRPWEYDLQQLAFQSGLPLQFEDVRRNLLIRGVIQASDNLCL